MSVEGVPEVMLQDDAAELIPLAVWCVFAWSIMSTYSSDGCTGSLGTYPSFVSSARLDARLCAPELFVYMLYDKRMVYLWKLVLIVRRWKRHLPSRKIYTRRHNHVSRTYLVVTRRAATWAIHFHIGQWRCRTTLTRTSRLTGLNGQRQRSIWRTIHITFVVLEPVVWILFRNYGSWRPRTAYGKR